MLVSVDVVEYREGEKGHKPMGGGWGMGFVKELLKWPTREQSWLKTDESSTITSQAEKTSRLCSVLMKKFGTVVPKLWTVTHSCSARSLQVGEQIICKSWTLGVCMLTEEILLYCISILNSCIYFNQVCIFSVGVQNLTSTKSAG